LGQEIQSWLGEDFTPIAVLVLGCFPDLCAVEVSVATDTAPDVAVTFNVLLIRVELIAVTLELAVDACGGQDAIAPHTNDSFEAHVFWMVGG
jgi:hypothetical protein